MSPRESSKIIKKGGGKVLTTFSTASPCAPAVRAFGVPVFYATSWCFPRSSQEGNQGVPPWIPLFVPRYKSYQEIDMFLGCAVLQGSHHARQAKKAKFVKAIPISWRRRERGPTSCGSTYGTARFLSLYRDRRSCKGKPLFSFIQVLEGSLRGTSRKKFPSTFSYSN